MYKIKSCNIKTWNNNGVEAIRYKDFEPCRNFIAEEFAVHLTTDIKTVQVAERKIKLGFNQVDPISKQESLGLRLKKPFLGEEIIEDFSALNYLIAFYFLKYKLSIEIDELGHVDRDSLKK